MSAIAFRSSGVEPSAASWPGSPAESPAVPSSSWTSIRVDRRSPRRWGSDSPRPEQAATDADLVIHASGSSAGLELALRLAAFEATILELSWFGDRVVSLPLGGAFHARRLKIVSSQVGSVAAAQRARWNNQRRMSLALSLLADSALDTLITGESDFDTLPETMTRLAASSGETLCHRIRYGDGDF